jgi:hypothetical protein
MAVVANPERSLAVAVNHPRSVVAASLRPTSEAVANHPRSAVAASLTKR